MEEPLLMSAIAFLAMQGPRYSVSASDAARIETEGGDSSERRTKDDARPPSLPIQLFIWI